MPKILPISDLRNYTEVLNQVDVNKPVYLTRNGRGTYVISKIDDYDPDETVEDLLKEIQKGEKSLVSDEGITLEQVAKKYNINI
ncbi:MAG TPA: prevent-host-death protein [Candidatus Limnocylindria bacterium]|nr:prevent-host-death protein [Candidatus Limnocylindria bacterium]